MLGARLRNILVAVAGLAASACIPDVRGEEPASPQNTVTAQTPPQQAVSPPAPEPVPPPRVGDVLESGVVITISLGSQQMHVFRNGALWRSSPVSTGKRGKRTPVGVYAVLQKKAFHRSNLYSNAPMPFMQRLTWSGIAIHAGHLPGYPASHGCIRVPKAFARDLFRITNPAATAVIIVDDPLPSGEAALILARQSDAVVPISPALLKRERPALAQQPTEKDGKTPASRMIPAPQPGVPPVPGTPVALAGGQTIQLAAALSADSAKAQWAQLSVRRPELKAMKMTIIPAVVNGMQYYRLRASAPDAHATCKTLRRHGIECFPVS